MSFSSDVREDLSRVEVTRQCCALSEINGAILSCRGLMYRGLNRYGLVIETEAASVVRRYFSLFKRWLNAGCEVRTVRTRQLGEHTRYVLTPRDEDVPGLLSALDLYDEASPFGLRVAPSNELIAKECCNAAFLRGVMLGRGSISNPEKAYHAELTLADEVLAEVVRESLARVEIHAKRGERKNLSIVYIKDGDQLSALLGTLGAHASMLEFENIRIRKGINNEVNRQMNCDNSNLEKALAASERQVDMIQLLYKKIGPDNLPAPLREIADLRLQYPDATLTDLGEMLDPPLGKSGVNARMRRLEALAEEWINR